MPEPKTPLDLAKNQAESFKIFNDMLSRLRDVFNLQQEAILRLYIKTQGQEQELKELRKGTH